MIPRPTCGYARAMKCIPVGFGLLARGSVLSIVLAVTACSGSVTLVSSKSKSQANPLDETEVALRDALNAYRTSQGAAPLTECASLNVASSAHADDMRDHAYLSDVGLDQSTVRTRDCEAGYLGGCGTSIAVAELVSSGIDDPAGLVAQWTGSPATKEIVLSKAMKVMGVAHAFGAFPPVWSADFGGEDEASCQSDAVDASDAGP